MEEKDKFQKDLEQYSHYNQQEADYKNIKENEPANKQSKPPISRNNEQFVTGASMNKKQNIAPPPPRGRKNRKALITALVLFLVLILGIVAAVLTTANNIVNKLDYDQESNTNIYVDPDSLQSLPDVYNILLLGVDALNEGEEYPRSDTMMLVSLDKVNKKIKLTSFMRDLYLYIPSYQKDKMNAACQLGGPQLIMDTIEYHFGVNIDAYVMVDFDSFVRIIDGLGGVEVEVTEQEARFIQNNISPDIKTGINYMNGESALVYARIRYLDSDFERTGRQRKVIESLLDKAKSASVFKLLELANQFAPEVKTNLTKSDISFLARNSVYYLSYEIEELCIPRDTDYKDIELPYPIGQALETNLSVAKEKVQQFIYPSIAEESSTEVSE